jgi:hypothetical protein
MKKCSLQPKKRVRMIDWSIWLEYDLTKYSLDYSYRNENLLCFINDSFKHSEIGSDLTSVQLEVSRTNEANVHYCWNNTKINLMKTKIRLKMLGVDMIFISRISLVVMEKILSFDINIQGYN